MSDPINDGGQWDMAVNLVTKYGMLPKKCFPETFSCESRYSCNPAAWYMNWNLIPLSF